jgi:hypothetical protein
MTTEITTTAAPAAVVETAVSSAPAATSTPAPTIDDQLSAIWEKNNPPEKFEDTPAASNSVAKALTGAPAEGETTDAPEESPTEETNTPSDLPKSEGSEPASSPAIAAPHSWSADVKAKWASLPPEVQEYVAQREKETHTKITQQGNELRAFLPVREVYEHIRSQGIPAGREPEVIANWARAQAFLDNNPVEGLKWLAQTYKVDLSQLSGVPQKPTDTQAIDDLFRDPRLDKIAPEIGELKGQVTQLQRQLQAGRYAEQARQQATVETIISEFSNRDDVKDLWTDLEPDIVVEIEAIKAQEPSLPYEKMLEKAFDRAKWANPSIRSRILDAQAQKEREAQEAARKKEQAEAAKKAEAAKRQASMNVRSGATASTPTFDGKWDDKGRLHALYDRITAGSR